MKSHIQGKNYFHSFKQIVYWREQKLEYKPQAKVRQKYLIQNEIKREKFYLDDFRPVVLSDYPSPCHAPVGRRPLGRFRFRWRQESRRSSGRRKRTPLCLCGWLNNWLVQRHISNKELRINWTRKQLKIKRKFINRRYKGNYVVIFPWGKRKLLSRSFSAQN